MAGVVESPRGYSVAQVALAYGSPGSAAVAVDAANPLPVAAAALPLPIGAATDAKLDAVRALLAGTLGISAAALPLPAGAATAANQAAANTTLAAIQALLSGTLGISAVALPLPSGAATDAKVEAVRALLAGTLTIQPAYAAPASWDGSSFDGRRYAGLEFQVAAAPTTAYTPQRSLDGATWAAVTVYDATGNAATSVGSAGLYTVKGGGYLRLNGGTGGSFYIAGGQ